MTTESDIEAMAGEIEKAARSVGDLAGTHEAYLIIAKAALAASPVERLRAENKALRHIAIGADCGRLCGAGNLNWNEQWKRSEQHIEWLLKQSL